MFDFIKNIIDDNHRRLASFRPIIARINQYEQQISSLTDDKLRQKTDEFKNDLNNGKTLDDILPEAFAVVREASKRTVGERA